MKLREAFGGGTFEVEGPEEFVCEMARRCRLLIVEWHLRAIDAEKRRINANRRVLAKLKQQLKFPDVPVDHGEPGR